MIEPAHHWQKIGARKVANDAWVLVQRHETEDHGGEPCLLNRISLVAFIAHVIGVKPEHGFDIEVAMNEYALTHEEMREHKH